MYLFIDTKKILLYDYYLIFPEKLVKY